MIPEVDVRIVKSELVSVGLGEFRRRHLSGPGKVADLSIEYTEIILKSILRS